MNDNKKLENFIPEKTSYYKEFNCNEEINNIIEKHTVIECIKTVEDPEIPVNIFDLGLIYSINIDKNNVAIEMTLTNPNCPVAGEIPQNVGKSIEHLKDLRSVDVKLVWEPAWHKDLMSEDAKLALDIF